MFVKFNFWPDNTLIWRGYFNFLGEKWWIFKVWPTIFVLLSYDFVIFRWANTKKSSFPLFIYFQIIKRSSNLMIRLI